MKKRSLLLACYTPLLLAGLVGIALKLTLIFSNLAALQRLYDTPALGPRLLLELTATDILANAFIIPLAVLLLLATLRVLTPRAAAAAACTLTLFYFIQLQAQQNLGQYMSTQMLYEAIHFGMANSEVALSYMKPSALIKLAIALAAIAATAELLRFARTSPTLARPLERAATAALPLLLMGLAVTAFSLPQSNSGIHRSAVQRAAETFFSAPAGEAKNTDIEDSLAAFNRLTHTPRQSPPAALRGKEAGANLIYFIMETGPADVLDTPAFIASLPPAMQRHLLAATQHHSTYPYTSDAIFSIFSGLYPKGRRELIERGGFSQHKVLLGQLRDRGYLTAAYQPALYDTGIDDRMFRQFGVEKFFTTTQDGDPAAQRQAQAAARALAAELLRESPHFDAAKRPNLEKMLTNDLHALQRMKADMQAAQAAGRPYAFIFLPQIGHGPWFPLGPDKHLDAYGRRLIQLQVTWLKEIADLLEQQGALDNTVIVFTADHGVRTKIEDPRLPIGTLASRSFKVPLVLYAPSSFQGTTAIAGATSHVDVEPTLSLLFGLAPENLRTEGCALWQPADERRIYLSANGYGGAEGYREGQYFMQNMLTEIQLKSPTMDFSDKSAARVSEAEHTQVSQALTEFWRIHNDIILKL